MLMKAVTKIFPKSSLALLLIAFSLALFFNSATILSNWANLELIHTLGISNVLALEEIDRFEIILDHSGQISATHGRPFISLARLSVSPVGQEREEDIQILADLPNSEVYFINRGYKNVQNEGWSTAVADFRTAVEIRPDSANVQLVWAQAQMYGLNDLEGSITSNLKAIQLDQDFSFLWVEVAHAQQMAGNDELALQSLDKASLTRLDGYTALAHAIRGAIAFKHGAINEAAQEFKIAVEISPKDLGFRVSYGNALCQLGKVNEARAVWQSVLVDDPVFQPALDANCGN